MTARSLLTAENVRLVRDLTGMGMMDAKKAVELAGGDDFAGDVVLAIGYVHASGLAINVGNDRHGWNLMKGAEYAERFRREIPELDAAFPKPGAVPCP
jgi:hypothetical protein